MRDPARGRSPRKTDKPRSWDIFNPGPEAGWGAWVRRGPPSCPFVVAVAGVPEEREEIQSSGLWLDAGKGFSRVGTPRGTLATMPEGGGANLQPEAAPRCRKSWRGLAAAPRGASGIAGVWGGRPGVDTGPGEGIAPPSPRVRSARTVPVRALPPL